MKSQIPVKFEVIRTSDSGRRHSPQPCEATVSEEYELTESRYHGRGFGSAEEQASWFAEGRNHRVTAITCENDTFNQRHREVTDVRWTVSFDSLYELVEFCAGFSDEVILSKAKAGHNPPLPVLEIYDDYRE